MRKEQTLTVITCDKCGREVPVTDATADHIANSWISISVFNNAIQMEDLDYCDICAKPVLKAMWGNVHETQRS